MKKYKVRSQVSRGKWHIVAEGSRQMVEALSRDLTVVRAVDAYEWKIVQPPDEFIHPPKEYNNIGLIDYNFDGLNEQNLDVENNQDYQHPFGGLLKKLWPGDVTTQLDSINDWIRKENIKRQASKISGSRVECRKIKEVSVSEFWRFVGILIVAAVLKIRGGLMWERKKRNHHTFTDPVDIGPSGFNLMAEYRFRDIRNAFSYAFVDKDDDGDWARIKLLIN